MKEKQSRLQAQIVINPLSALLEGIFRIYDDVFFKLLMINSLDTLCGLLKHFPFSIRSQWTTNSPGRFSIVLASILIY